LKAAGDTAQGDDDFQFNGGWIVLPGLYFYDFLTLQALPAL
jgi:hypothetical protein